MRFIMASACLFLGSLAANATEAEVIPADQVEVLKPGADSPAATAEPVAERWGGVYGGVSLGYGFLEDTAPATGKDWIYGGFVGYNHQFGNFVVGLEGNIDRADIMFTDGSQVTGDYIYAGRFRAGFATEKFMVYGTIGAEHATTKRGLLPVASDPKDTALQLGAGFDFAVTDKVSLGVDYTYAKYKDFDLGNIPFPLDVTTQKVAARLTYTFN